MEKDFDGWNVLKKSIHVERGALNANQRELWWISFGMNVGVEIDGKDESYERPGIVLRRFNREMAWVIPTTSREKNLPFYSRFSYEGKDYWAVLTQVRVVSTKRFLRKVGMISQERFSEMQKKLAEFVFFDENERNPARGGVPRRPKP